MTDTPRVEQRHREAAADYVATMQFPGSPYNATPRGIRCGHADGLHIVQAFARFEATHLATLAAELDALREAATRFLSEADNGFVTVETDNALRTALRTDAPGTQEG
jgi:hypothetical protein